MNLLAIPLAYVYKITHRNTGEFYIGSKYSNRTRTEITPEQSLLVEYFTSGKLKIDIENNPDQYLGEVIFRSNEEVVSRDGENLKFVVLWYEQLLIRENIKNPLCKNKHYTNVDTNKKVWFVDNTGKKHSKEVNAKKASKGHKNGMYKKKHTDSAKKNMSDKKKLLVGKKYPHYGKIIVRRIPKTIQIDGILYAGVADACEKLCISYYKLRKIINSSLNPHIKVISSGPHRLGKTASAKDAFSGLSLGRISVFDARWKSGEIVGVRKIIKGNNI